MKSQKPHAASASHEEWIVSSLRSDPEFAVEYLKQAMAEMNDPDGRGAPLLALRQIAEACGGLAKPQPRPEPALANSSCHSD